MMVLAPPRLLFRPAAVGAEFVEITATPSAAYTAAAARPPALCPGSDPVGTGEVSAATGPRRAPIPEAPHLTRPGPEPLPPVTPRPQGSRAAHPAPQLGRAARPMPSEILVPDLPGMVSAPATSPDSKPERTSAIPPVPVPSANRPLEPPTVSRNRAPVNAAVSPAPVMGAPLASPSPARGAAEAAAPSVIAPSPPRENIRDAGPPPLSRALAASPMLVIMPPAAAAPARPAPSPAPPPPSLHIGTLEVHVVAPVSAPVMAAPRAAARAPARAAVGAAGRLTRGFGVFGLGQS
jgi:hypothetical protein